MYLAYWDLYTKVTGYQAEKLADEISIRGTTVSVVAGIITGGVFGPYVGGTVGAIGTGETQLLGAQIKSCNTNYKQAYVRLKLVTGSWQNSVIQLPFRGLSAFNMSPEVSCN